VTQRPTDPAAKSIIRLGDIGARGLSSSDSIEEYERKFDRQAKVTLVVLAGGMATVIVVLGYLSLSYPGGFPPWWPGFLVLEAVVSGAFIIWFRKRLRRYRSLPRAMSPRLMSQGVGTGPTLVFDNGVVLSFQQSGPSFYLFGSPGGAKAIPRPDDLREFLRRILRFRRALRVGRKQGPDSLRGRLDEIRMALGATFSWLFVYLPKPSAPVDPPRASWVALATFGGPRFQFDPNRTLGQLDAIAGLLAEAVDIARASGPTSSR
jgi:hypothetical protein